MLSDDRFGDNLLRLAITVHLRSVNQDPGKLVSNAAPRLPCHARSLCEKAASVLLARDRAQSFNQRLALCAIVNNECVVFAMR